MFVCTRYIQTCPDPSWFGHPGAKMYTLYVHTKSLNLKINFGFDLFCFFFLSNLVKLMTTNQILITFGKLQNFSQVNEFSTSSIQLNRARTSRMSRMYKFQLNRARISRMSRMYKFQLNRTRIYLECPE